MSQTKFDVLIVAGSVREKERALRAIAAGYALKNNLTINLVLAGGKTRQITEAESMLESITNYFSINKEKIYLEDKSIDTASNIINALEIIKRNKWTNVGILSSRYHLKRCINLAKSYQLQATGLSIENIYSKYDEDKLSELNKYNNSSEIKSIKRLENILNTLLIVDPLGKLPNLTSKLYYKFFE